MNTPTIPSIPTQPRQERTERECDHAYNYVCTQYYTEYGALKMTPDMLRQTTMTSLLQQEMSRMRKPLILVAEARLAVVRNQDHAAMLRFMVALRIERIEKGFVL